MDEMTLPQTQAIRRAGEKLLEAEHGIWIEHTKVVARAAGMRPRG